MLQFAFWDAIPSARRQELKFRVKDIGQVRQYGLNIDGLKGEFFSPPPSLSWQSVPRAGNLDLDVNALSFDFVE